MLLASLAVGIGFVLLAWSAARFVDGAASIARHFRISPMIIGLTIVSLCTSFPEMHTSCFMLTPNKALFH
jgi:cation:H+ antiporter